MKKARTKGEVCPHCGKTIKNGYCEICVKNGTAIYDMPKSQIKIVDKNKEEREYQKQRSDILEQLLGDFFDFEQEDEDEVLGYKQDDFHFAKYAQEVDFEENND